MALEFKCEHCGEIKYSRFLKVGETANCKSCNKKTIIPKDSKVIRTSDMPKILTNQNNNTENIDNLKKTKKNIQNKDKKNIISRGFKDYPAMETLAMILDIFAIIAVIIGVIQILYFFTIIPEIEWTGASLIILQVFLTAIVWLLLKFFSESIKILCDMAYYLKSIDKNTQ